MKAETRRTLRGALMTGIIAVFALTATAAAEEAAVHPPASFFAGDYALVGQHPDGGAAYAGTARIEATGDNTLILTRTVAGESVTETGRLETLSLLGEGTALMLLNTDGIPVASCLWLVDFDNYARLTCLRVAPLSQPDILGMEALFPRP